MSPFAQRSPIDLSAGPSASVYTSTGSMPPVSERFDDRPRRPGRRRGAASIRLAQSARRRGGDGGAAFEVSVQVAPIDLPYRPDLGSRQLAEPHIPVCRHVVDAKRLRHFSQAQHFTGHEHRLERMRIEW